MRWFGESWGSPVCESEDHAPTPVGHRCPQCGEDIKDGDQGLLIPWLADKGWSEMAWHKECFMSAIGLRARGSA